MVTTVAPLRNRRRRSLGRPFSLVWMSVIVSSTGDGMFVTAFPLLAATLTRDPVLIAGVTIASRLPWLFFSMLTGALADRMDRRRLMIGADLIRFVIVGMFGIAIAVGVEELWMLYSCAFLLGAAETLHVNAAQAIIPALIEHDQLLDANARFGSAQTAAAQFVGPPLGSTLFNLSGSIPFLADAVSFAGSAALVSGLPDVHQVEPASTRLRDDVREGLRYMRQHAALRRIALVLAVINFFYFAAISLLVLYTSDQLHAGKIVYTALFVAAALGTVTSRWFVGRLHSRFGSTRTMTISFWMWASTVIVLAVTGIPAVAIGAFVLLGFGNGLWLVLNTTIRQQVTPSRLLGRMNAAYRTISWGVVPFGSAFGGALAKAFGLRAPFIAAGATLLLIAMFAKKILAPVTAATTR